MITTLFLLASLAANDPQTVGPAQWGFDPAAKEPGADVIMPVNIAGPAAVDVTVELHSGEQVKTVKMTAPAEQTLALLMGRAELARVDEKDGNRYQVKKPAGVDRVVVKSPAGAVLGDASVKLPEVLEILGIEVRKPEKADAGAGLEVAVSVRVVTPHRRRATLVIEVVDGEGKVVHSEKIARPGEKVVWPVPKQFADPGDKSVRVRFDYPRRDGILSALKPLKAD